VIRSIYQRQNSRPAPSRETVPDELIVKLAENSQPFDQLDFDAKVMEEFEFPKGLLASSEGPMLRLKLSADTSVSQALAQLKDDSRFEFAEPNFVYTLEDTPQQPNDLDPKLWGLNNTGQSGGTAGADVSSREAWKLNTGSKAPLISVIDTGIDYNHPDLAANMWVNPGEIPGDGIDNDNNGVIDDVHGYNAYADNGDPMDTNSHGTHCAGTIAAVGNNGEGVTGVMQHANLMAVKIFGDSGRTSTDAIVRGLLYSARMGADITNNSWGGKQPSEAILQAFQAHPGLHVVAAGNAGSDNDKSDNFPSNYDLDNIVAVAATDHNDEKPRFSQYGATKVDVAAPGHHIWSTVPGGNYGEKSGTSMATPHVTGGAGLILSEFPEADNSEIKQRLIYGSDRKTALQGVSVSNGRVNFATSLEDDSVAPGAPNDFETEEVGIKGGSVSWTTVGDDKWANGAAQVVELWQSPEPLNNENLSQAQKFMLENRGQVGDLATFSFQTEPKETPENFHFAMRSVDNVGNASKVRYTSVEVPAAAVALKDSFDTDDLQFEAGGDFHRVDLGGRGKVFSSRPGEAGSAPISELVSRKIDLTDKKNSYLKFDYKTDLGWGETAEVWVSTDGENWNLETDLRRQSSSWREQSADLSAYDGQTVQVKFKVSAKEGKRFGGMRLDNVKVLVESRI
jgi:subtilisin family serine protease